MDYLNFEEIKKLSSYGQPQVIQDLITLAGGLPTIGEEVPNIYEEAEKLCEDRRWWQYEYCHGSGDPKGKCMVNIHTSAGRITVYCRYGTVSGVELTTIVNEKPIKIDRDKKYGWCLHRYQSGFDNFLKHYEEGVEVMKREEQSLASEEE